MDIRRRANEISDIEKNRILQGLYILLILLLGILVYENHASQSLEASHDLPHTNASSWQEEIDKLTNGEEKIAYLTFDDGPSKAVTPKVLDILKEEDVKATFFVIGKMVDTYPETVKRAYEEGHYIANHGYHHRNAILYIKMKRVFEMKSSKQMRQLAKQ